MNHTTTTLSAKIELGLLCALLFVLPTSEGLKNAFLVCYLAFWAGRRFSVANLRNLHLSGIEYSLLAMIGVCVVSTLSNWPMPNDVKGLLDTIRFTLLFWCIYRTAYTDQQHKRLAIFLTAGLVVGLMYAGYELMIGSRRVFELHSAGVLTQSAIYVSVVFITVLGVLLPNWLAGTRSDDTKPMQWFWLTSWVAMGVAVIIMGSRGAFLALALVLVFFGVIVNRAKFWVGLAGGTVAAVIIGIAIHTLSVASPLTATVHERMNTDRYSASNTERIGYLRLAIAQIRSGEALWFGLGPRNFKSIDLPRLHFDPPLELTEKQKQSFGHAHNLFLTILVEQGIFGFLAFVGFLGLITHRLWQWWQQDKWCDWRWFAACGALAIPVITGSVNTPFYQEHAMLAMGLMAIFMRSSEPIGNRG